MLRVNAADAPLTLALNTSVVSRNTRIAAADAVRALAIFAVVAHHIIKAAQPMWHGRPHTFYSFGVWGVDCFFVLSGLLLGGEYVRKLLAPTIIVPSTRQFWAKRVLRIVPLYFACVLISALIDGALLHEAPTARAVVAHLLFLQNLDAKLSTSINGPYWTMPIDIEFYLLLPLYALGMAAIFRAFPDARRVPILLASLAAISVGGLLYRYYAARYNPTALRADVLGMSSAFCIGAALSVVSQARWKPTRMFCVVLLAVAALLEVVVERITSMDTAAITTRLVLGQTFFDVVGAMSAALVMYVVIEGNIPFVDHIVKSRAVLELAALAYGVYLLHYPISLVVSPFVAHHGAVDRIFGIAVATIVPTLLLAYILNRVIERPFLALKSRVSPAI